MHDSSVEDSRYSKTEGTVRRRRKCRACRVKWTTFEIDYGKYNALMDELKTLRRDMAFIRRALGTPHADLTSSGTGVSSAPHTEDGALTP